MKAVIVEIRVHKAAALTNDGGIIKIKNKNYAIGQVIELKIPVTGKRARIAIWATSAAAVVMLFGVSAWAYFTPYTYVSLDVNPSIEYAVNRFNRVLSANAVNDDGSEILDKLDLNNKTIEEAIKATVDEIAHDGYFEGQDPGGIVISTSSEDVEGSEQLAKDLQTSAEEATADNATPVEVEAVSIGLARVTAARALGTTPGKLNLVEKLQASAESADSINVEEWLQKPVKEIMKAVNENKKSLKDAKNEDEKLPTSSSSAAESAVAGSVSSEAGKTDSSNTESGSTSSVNESASSVNSSALNSSASASVSKAPENHNESENQSAQSKVTGKPETSSAKQNNGKSSEKGKSLSNR